MKKILYLFVFLFLAITSMAEVTDLSGTWNLNKEKSTLNDQFSMAPSQMILVQTANLLDVEKHASYQGQEFTINDKFTLDGNECVNKGWQDSQKTSVAGWSADGKILTITSKIPMQDGTDMTIVEIYQLEENNLKVGLTVSSSFGEMTETHLFDKQ